MIPQGLKNLPRWVCHRSKQPLDPKTGKAASSTDPATWGTYEQAQAFAALNSVDGLGIMLGDGLAGVDIDHAYTPEGPLKAAAAAVVELLGEAYYEESPSGNGLHGLGWGKKNTDKCRVKLEDGCELEVYDHARLFTVTGNTIDGSLEDVADFQTGLDAICSAYLTADVPGGAASDPRVPESEWSDQEVMGWLRGCEHCFEFISLWEGDLDYAGGDHSRADAMLIERLYYASGGDIAQTDRLFRQSGLMREKWDEMRGAQTYGERTILHRVHQGGRVRMRHRPLTEVGVAERLADRHSDKLLHISEMGWYSWDGRRLAPDYKSQVQRRTVEVVRSIYEEEAPFIPEGEDHEKMLKKLKAFALACERHATIVNITKAAERLLAALPEELDADDYVINCTNGALDLKTLKLHPHSPVDRITKQAAAAYLPGEQCPMFDKFLNEIMLGDKDLVEYLWWVLATCLTGDVSMQKFFIFYGVGANGKSVLMSVVRGYMGDYAIVAMPGTFIEKKGGDGIPNDLAALKGARLVSDIETKQSVLLNENRVKAISGNEDMSARILYHEPFTFKPKGKLVLVTNHKPIIQGTDNGLWRRIVGIPFRAVIPPEKQNPKLGEIILAAERDGIFTKAAQYCNKWLKGWTPPTPEIVKAFTLEYQQDMDVIGLFLEDCCVQGESLTVPFGSLYSAYQRWAMREGYKSALTSTMFGIKMRERGFQQVRANDEKRTRAYKGLHVVDEILM